MALLFLFVHRGATVSRADEPEIGDVDEGVVEGGEDTGNAEDELACDGGDNVSGDALSSRARRPGGGTYPRGPGDPRRCSPGRDGRS